MAQEVSARWRMRCRSIAPSRTTRPRTDALYGAWLSGICLGAVGMALHHKLCHTLGGSFNLPHAETHTSFSRTPSPTTRPPRLTR